MISMFIYGYCSNQEVLYSLEQCYENYVPRMEPGPIQYIATITGFQIWHSLNHAILQISQYSIQIFKKNWFGLGLRQINFYLNQIIQKYILKIFIRLVLILFLSIIREVCI